MSRQITMANMEKLARAFEALKTHQQSGTGSETDQSATPGRWVGLHIILVLCWFHGSGFTETDASYRPTPRHWGPMLSFNRMSTST